MKCRDALHSGVCFDVSLSGVCWEGCRGDSPGREDHMRRGVSERPGSSHRSGIHFQLPYEKSAQMHGHFLKSHDPTSLADSPGREDGSRDQKWVGTGPPRPTSGAAAYGKKSLTHS